ncbi:GNAT family N-acetyltransferase [Paenibacillus sp.]|jgi:predicted acetyltransferase|uniref:GNAT family N-acetyltransferase n=1 Tax=Paenibacillus sp. TaxID=58172 RepID=UPI002836E6E9|nr:GNAT family N-acetyltransferase [Paenibacillus sp.]MDR0270800.1 GNAT family N-acetyltransferase [Paenibacillus sp.]
MNVTVELCTLEDKFIIYNLYPLYLHDLAEIRKVMPNKYGVFEDSDDYKTLQEEQAVFDIWWEKENILFPYLIRVDGLPAGFGLVATPPYLVDESEFMMNEFFISRPFRSKGVGEQAAVSIFNLFPGKWMLFTTEGENNVRTQNFWRKTLSNFTSSRYTEKDEELPHFGMNKAFWFESTKK